PSLIEVFGWNIAPETRLPVRSDSSTPSDSVEWEPQSESRAEADVQFGFVHAPDFAGSARVRLGTFAAARRTTALDGSQLPIPGAVTGRLARSNQVDHYLLDLCKDQKVTILAEGRPLGLPVEPVLTLTDPNGAVVAVEDNPSPRKPTLLSYI